MSYLEKRDSERITCQLNATIVAEARFHDGFIKNVSESGLKYSMASSINPPAEENLGESIELIFSIFSNEVIRLDCTPIWYVKDRSEGHVLIGMQIISPPPRYNELIRNIYLCRYL